MTEPTDAELWQFYMTLPGATPTSQPDPIEIMRATLAKWVQPAGAGEHKPGCPALGGYGHGVEECCCGATPQPTQAQAGAVPMPRRTLLDMTQCYSDRETFGRAVEAWHGIKGGQHGTE